MESFYAELDEHKTVDEHESEHKAADEKHSDEKKSEEKAPESFETAEVSDDDDESETMDVEGFGNYGATFSVMEFVKRLLKYLVEGLVVAIAASTIPKKSLDVQEVGVIALSAAATFALLDLFAPTISYAAR